MRTWTVLPTIWIERLIRTLPDDRYRQHRPRRTRSIRQPPSEESVSGKLRFVFQRVGTLRASPFFYAIGCEHGQPAAHAMTHLRAVDAFFFLFLFMARLKASSASSAALRARLAARLASRRASRACLHAVFACRALARASSADSRTCWAIRARARSSLLTVCRLPLLCMDCASGGCPPLRWTTCA